MFWDDSQKAYVSTDSGSGNRSTFHQGGLVKIPYRIFVGGISFNATKEELKEFFSRYGAVRDTKIIRDQEGLSKGYGFVTFHREEDAQNVMRMGTIFYKEKRLNISEAYRKHAVPNQQVMTMPVAAPTSWSPASSAPVYYTSINQASLIPTPMQMPTLQIPSERTAFSVVSGGVTSVPQYYYLYH